MKSDCKYTYLTTFYSWNISVLHDLVILLRSVIPTFRGWILMAIGATIGTWLSYVFGGFDSAIIWLFGFTLIDYLTGNFAAVKNGKWQSMFAYKGIFKKAFIFVMIAICHGVDVSMGLDFVRTTCIFAYIANEVGSIVENIERMGYGDIIPPILRSALKVAKEREAAMTGNMIGTKSDNTTDATKIEKKGDTKND